jgi:AbrB family looped-hinge helix DNA binding protein
MARYRLRPIRGSRRLESAPQYSAPDAPPIAFDVIMADRGRLVLPAEVRARLGINAGDRLTLWIDPDGTMRLQTAATYARSLRGMFKHLAPNRILSEELIAERRREAAMEEQDTQAAMARARRRRSAK